MVLSLLITRSLERVFTSWRLGVCPVERQERCLVFLAPHLFASFKPCSRSRHPARFLEHLGLNVGASSSSFTRSGRSWLMATCRAAYLRCAWASSSLVPRLALPSGVASQVPQEEEGRRDSLRAPLFVFHLGRKALPRLAPLTSHHPPLSHTSTLQKRNRIQVWFRWLGQKPTLPDTRGCGAGAKIGVPSPAGSGLRRPVYWSARHQTRGSWRAGSAALSCDRCTFHLCSLNWCACWWGTESFTCDCRTPLLSPLFPLAGVTHSPELEKPDVAACWGGGVGGEAAQAPGRGWKGRKAGLAPVPAPCLSQDCKPAGLGCGRAGECPCEGLAALLSLLP